MNNRIIIILSIATIAITASLSMNAYVRKSGVFAEQRSGEGSAAAAVRESNAGGITVAVTPKTTSGKEWSFDVKLTTHTGSLDLDPAASAFLVDDTGVRRPAIAWEGDPPGGHHRLGVLKFAAIEPRPRAVRLVMTGIGGPDPRNFTWE